MFFLGAGHANAPIFLSRVIVSETFNWELSSAVSETSLRRM